MKAKIFILLFFLWGCSKGFAPRSIIYKNNQNPLNGQENLPSTESTNSCSQKNITWGSGCHATALTKSSNSDVLTQEVFDVDGTDGYTGFANLVCINNTWELDSSSNCQVTNTESEDGSDDTTTQLKTTQVTLLSNVLDLGSTPSSWVQNSGYSGDRMRGNFTLNINWLAGPYRRVYFSNSNPFNFLYSGSNVTTFDKEQRGFTVDFYETDIPDGTRDGQTIERQMQIFPESGYFFESGPLSLTLKFKLDCHNHGDVWNQTELRCLSSTNGTNTNSECLAAQISWGNGRCTGRTMTLNSGQTQTIADMAQDPAGYKGEVVATCGSNGQFTFSNQVCNVTNNVVMGRVDGIVHDPDTGQAVLAGWAVDLDSPNDSVSIVLQSGNIPGDNLIANQPSSDVNDALLGMGHSVSGNHRFGIPIDSRYILKNVTIYAKELVATQLPQVVLGTAGPILNKCSYYLANNTKTTEFVELLKSINGTDVYALCENADEKNYGYGTKENCARRHIELHGASNGMCLP